MTPEQHKNLGEVRKASSEIKRAYNRLRMVRAADDTVKIELGLQEGYLNDLIYELEITEGAAFAILRQLEKEWR